MADVRNFIALFFKIHSPDSGEMNVEADIRIDDTFPSELALRPSLDDILVKIAASESPRKELGLVTVGDRCTDGLVSCPPAQTIRLEIEIDLLDAIELRRWLHLPVELSWLSIEAIKQIHSQLCSHSSNCRRLISKNGGWLKILIGLLGSYSSGR